MRDFGSQAKYTVYCHTLFDGRKYFGKTSQPPSRRWRGNGEGYSGTPFYEAIKRYGWQAFDHETIATGLTELQAKAMEESLIKQYISRITGFKEMTVCEDEDKAYQYWKYHFNHNPDDCCNLRKERHATED